MKRDRHRSFREAVLNARANGVPIPLICKIFGISPATFYRWSRPVLKLPDKQRGRPRKLTHEQEMVMVDHLKTNPSATNTELCSVVDNTIRPTSVSSYLRRMNYTRKKICDTPNKSLDARCLTEIKEYSQAISTVPFESRVYVDESFIYDNEARTFGRSPKGQKIYRPREKHGRRWTFYLAVRFSGLVHHPVLSNQNATDVNFVHYVKETLAPNLRVGDTVIWDRLGRAGRCKNPQKQHYNPEARRSIEEKGARLLFLPPKGHLFNPIELAFGCIKNVVRQTYGCSEAGLEKRPRTETEVQQVLEAAASRLCSRQVKTKTNVCACCCSILKCYP